MYKFLLSSFKFSRYCDLCPLNFVICERIIAVYLLRKFIIIENPIPHIVVRRWIEHGMSHLRRSDRSVDLAGSLSLTEADPVDLASISVAINHLPLEPPEFGRLGSCDKICGMFFLRKLVEVVVDIEVDLEVFPVYEDVITESTDIELVVHPIHV